MFVRKNSWSREKSTGKQTVHKAVGCVTEPLERRVLLSGGYLLKTLASFDGSDGMYPESGLVEDAAGNLYGTTHTRGAENGDGGTVFEIAAGTHALTTLFTFPFEGGEGYGPTGDLVIDEAGNLYGTTQGTVFEIAANTHQLTTLATFTGNNGYFPQGGLISDAAGNLYGTTSGGGPSDLAVGTVFEIAAGTHSLTTLATFLFPSGMPGTDAIAGNDPQGGLIVDSAGNLYGTTFYGGTGRELAEGNLGNGTVFEVASGTHTLALLADLDFTSGINPSAGLIADADGNLYGTASQDGANEDGTVFEVAAGTDALTTLATFNGTDGAAPLGNLIADSDGNLYGTTDGGGSSGDGTVFEIAAGTHALTTLAAFNGSDGMQPVSGLTRDAVGNLYGTTQLGGSSGDGTVFELIPVGSISGTVFDDANGDGVQERREPGVAGVTVSLQRLRNGNPIGHASTAITDANGNYSFSGLVADTYRVTQTLTGGQSLTTPAGGSYTIALAAGQNSAGDNFGDFTPAAIYLFTTLHNPNADADYYGTDPYGISGHTIDGDYRDSNFNQHDFIYNDRTGTYTILNDPSAHGDSTVVNGISGDTVVGDYTDSHNTYGFIYNDITGTYTTLDVPNAFVGVNGTEALGISGNNVVGVYLDELDESHGFIYNRVTRTYTTLDIPNATYGTMPNDISGNIIVGSYTDNSGLTHGFIYNDITDAYTTLDDPNDGQTADNISDGVDNGTIATSISGNAIVGHYHDRNDIAHGFIYNDKTGAYATIDDPNTSQAIDGSNGTWVTGISGNTIVGIYRNVRGNIAGFIATPLRRSPASISGNVFNDRIGNRIREPQDRGLGDITITLQKLRNGNPFGQALITATDSSGDYSFTGLAAGTYRVTQTLPPDQTITTVAGGSYTIALAAGQDSADNDFGDHQKAIRGN